MTNPVEKLTFKESWNNKLGFSKYIGILVMALGPWFLIYRYMILGSAYKELVIGSLVFLLIGSFVWFVGWDVDT
jgi:hypothetical protein